MEKLYDNISEYQETKNETILEKIIEEHMQLVYYITYKYRNLLPHYDDIDIRNELLMEFQNAVESYSKKTKCKFSSYCYMLMKNKLLNLARKESAQKRNIGSFFYMESLIPGQVFSFNEVLQEENTLEKNFIDKENKKNIESFLENTLKSHEVMLYKLYIYGDSVKEISEKLEISEKSCRNKLTYIKRKIRNNSNSYKSD